MSEGTVCAETGEGRDALVSKTLDVRRRELKYRISLAESLRAQQLLSQVLPGDANNGPDGYTVRSLYFDTLRNRDYEEKEDGLERRKKVRLRVYSPTAAVAKLELKEKDGAWQRKQSLVLPREAAERLLRGDYGPLAALDQPLAQQLYRLMLEELYRPVCTVEYRRYAFVVPANDIRITFDRHLTAGEGIPALFDGEDFLYPVGAPDDVTMEVKFNRFLFSYIRDLLEGIEKLPVSYSKYVMSRRISHTFG